MVKNEMNPLVDLENDIRELMKKYGTLVHKMNEYEIKVEGDTKKILLSFIEVADAFDNTFKQINPRLASTDKQTKKWISNFRTIFKMLLRALKLWNVTPIEIIIGEKANPYWHEITEVIKNPAKENETIIEEIKKGYLWNGKLLRAAEVKAVSND